MDSADGGRAWKFKIIRIVQLQIQKAFDIQLEIREGDVRNINAFVLTGCAVFGNDTDGCACFCDDDVGECAIANDAVADTNAQGIGVTALEDAVRDGDHLAGLS